jgi:RHS repeat-associated protein
LELAGFLIVDSRHGSIDRVNYVFMVTSVTPSIEQYMPPAQARAEYRSAYVTLDPVAYLSSTTLVTQLAKQTHASPNVAITNGTDSYHRNHQYSITAITTSAGAIAERYAYSAYGQPTILDPSGVALPTSNFSIRTSYTGREWDATLGLHHFRARWMSPSAGRFLGRDPIGYEGSEWHFYEFLDSQSLVNSDAEGHSTAPPQSGNSATASGNGFWSFLPCGSFAYTYTITANFWGGAPVPVKTLAAFGWIPVAPAGGGGGATPCPACYTCCITSVINDTTILTVTARRGWVRTVTLTLSTTLSLGHCTLATAPCPPPRVTNNPPRNFSITIQVFPS